MTVSLYQSGPASLLQQAANVISADSELMRIATKVLPMWAPSLLGRLKALTAKPVHYRVDPFNPECSPSFTKEHKNLSHGKPYKNYWPIPVQNGDRERDLDQAMGNAACQDILALNPQTYAVKENYLDPDNIQQFITSITTTNGIVYVGVECNTKDPIKYAPIFLDANIPMCPLVADLTMTPYDNIASDQQIAVPRVLNLEQSFRLVELVYPAYAKYREYLQPAHLNYEPGHVLPKMAVQTLVIAGQFRNVQALKSAVTNNAQSDNTRDKAWFSFKKKSPSVEECVTSHPVYGTLPIHVVTVKNLSTHYVGVRLVERDISEPQPVIAQATDPAIAQATD